MIFEASFKISRLFPLLILSIIFRAADGIKIINQLNDDTFTTVIKYVHKNMSLSGENAATDTEDDGGLEK